MGSILLSYILNVGLVNLHNKSVFSISFENKDWDIYYKALLMASVLETWGVTKSQGLWNVER